MSNQERLPRLLAGCTAMCLCAAAPASAQFQASKVSLESNLTLSDLGATFAEDTWGSFSASGREYAVIGLSQGTGFVEVTNPAAPVIVCIELQSLQGRDIKVYQDFVYSTAEPGPTPTRPAMSQPRRSSGRHGPGVWT